MRTTMLALVFISGAASAAAQVVTNPTALEFVPSTDHAVVLPPDLGGGPAVTSYEVRYYVVGSSAVVCSANLGKPTPVSGLISLPVTPCVPMHWTTRYEARVTALGPTGAGTSEVSNPFAVVGPVAPPSAPRLLRP